MRIEETGQHERRQPEPDRPTCAQLRQEAHGCEARSPRAVEQVVQRADEPVVQEAQQEGDGAARTPRARCRPGPSQNPRTELTMSSVKPFTDDSLSVSNVNSMAYSQGNPRVITPIDGGYSDRLRFG